MGDNVNGELTQQYGPVGPLPPVSQVRGVPRPPASIPRVASRTPSVPIPKAAPLLRADEPKALAAKPAPEPRSHPCRRSRPKRRSQRRRAPAQPPQQSAAVQVKPAETETTPQAAAPAPSKARRSIQPTQEMPKVQGLEKALKNIARRPRVGEDDDSQAGYSRPAAAKIRSAISVRYQRQMTGIEFDGGRIHALGQESLEVGIDGLIELRHRIP